MFISPPDIGVFSWFPSWRTYIITVLYHRTLTHRTYRRRFGTRTRSRFVACANWRLSGATLIKRVRHALVSSGVKKSSGPYKVDGGYIIQSVRLDYTSSSKHTRHWFSAIIKMVKTLPFGDLQVPVPGFGAMGLSFGLGSNLTLEEAEPVLLKAVELGCTFWDTAVSHTVASLESIARDADVT
jgi:hypothetical protein